MKSEFIRFLVAGAIGFLVDTGILYIALELGSGYFFGRALSFLAAVWMTWQINRRFTFPTGRQRSTWHEWWQYLLAMSVGGAVNYAAYGTCIVSLPQSAALPVIAVAAGSIAGMAINFLSAKLWVFKKAR